jgi:hypothetical protein
LPALSVPDVVGGPTVPVMIVKLTAARLPLASVECRLVSGLVHDTGTLLPRKLMVGWPGSLLHSKTPPVELATNPDPETVTL